MHDALIFLGVFFLCIGAVKLTAALILRWKEKHNGK